MCLVLLAAGFVTSPAQSATLTLNPVADTFADFFNGDTNFGSGAGLATNILNLSPRAYSYLKFDLSSIPANEFITGATLNLFQIDQGGAAGGGPADVYQFVDTWSESTLTWNNAPATVGPRLASNSATGAAGWVQWDLFELGAWDADADQADGFLSVRLVEGSSGDSAHTWCSKESDPALDNCLIDGEVDIDDVRVPFLTVETAIIPVPAAVWLFVSALGLLGWIRHKAN